MTSKILCPDCRSKFKLIGFGFEELTMPVQGHSVCGFCKKQTDTPDTKWGIMVSGIPYMFKDIPLMELLYVKTP